MIGLGLLNPQLYRLVDAADRVGSLEDLPSADLERMLRNVHLTRRAIGDLSDADYLRFHSSYRIISERHGEERARSVIGKRGPRTAGEYVAYVFTGSLPDAS
jgi:hypothetical protein